MLPNPCLDGEPVTITNGAGSYDSGLFEVPMGGIEVSEMEIVDLDGDGTDEHLAHITCMPGGSGTMDGVWAFHDDAGSASVVAHIAGGDRADGGLDTVRVEGTSVIVGRSSGTTEGLCCPTHVTEETWQLTAGGFVRVRVGETRPR